MNDLFFNLLAAILLVAVADILLGSAYVNRSVRICVAVLIVFAIFWFNLAARMAP